MSSKGRCIVGRIAADACGRRIGVIAAITRQIGRMRPTHCGRLWTAYFISSLYHKCGRRAADALCVHSRSQCVGRNASNARRPQCGRLWTDLKRKIRALYLFSAKHKSMYTSPEEPLPNHFPASPVARRQSNESHSHPVFSLCSQCPASSISVRAATNSQQTWCKSHAILKKV